MKMNRVEDPSLVMDDFINSFLEFNRGEKAPSRDTFEKIAKDLNKKKIPACRIGMWWAEGNVELFYETYAKEELDRRQLSKEPDQKSQKVIRLPHSPQEKKQEKKIKSKPEPFKAKVHVDVNQSGSVGDRLESFFKRELRSLKDVVLTEEMPDYRIIITSTGQKNRQDLAFSFVVTETLDLRKYLGEDEEIPPLLKLVLEAVYEHVIYRGIWICYPDSLRELCEQIVADFDKRVLERARKAWPYSKTKTLQELLNIDNIIDSLDDFEP